MLPVMANQGGKHSSDHAANRLEYLSIVLDLTETQHAGIRDLQSEHIAAVTGINETFKPVMDEMREVLKNIRLENLDGGESFESSREKAESVRAQYEEQLAPMRKALDDERDAFHERLKALLQPDQLEKYEALTAWKEKSRAGMKHPNHQRGPGSHPGLHKGWENGEPRGHHKGWDKDGHHPPAHGKPHHDLPGKGSGKPGKPGPPEK